MNLAIYDLFVEMKNILLVIKHSEVWILAISVNIWDSFFCNCFVCYITVKQVAASRMLSLWCVSTVWIAETPGRLVSVGHFKQKLKPDSAKAVKSVLIIMTLHNSQNDIILYDTGVITVSFGFIISEWPAIKHVSYSFLRGQWNYSQEENRSI